LETRQDPEARRQGKTHLVKMLYDKGWDAKDVRQLFRFIDWMMDLPAELEKAFRQEVYQFEEEKKMPFVTSVERAGIVKGLLEGIEVSLKVKFGPEGVALFPEIRQLEELDVLRAVLRAIETAKTADELRAVWAS
jgi:hypothetical protein